MKNYASLLLYLTPFGGFIQQLIEEQWNTINLIKYTNFHTSLSKNSSRYLERSRQHFHSSDPATDHVFLLPAELSVNVFSTFFPWTHILGPEIGRARSSQFLFCSLSPLSPLLEGFHALIQRERTLNCAGQDVLSCLAAQNLHTVVLPWAQLSTWMLAGYGCIPLLFSLFIASQFKWFPKAAKDHIRQMSFPLYTRD